MYLFFIDNISLTRVLAVFYTQNHALDPQKFGARILSDANIINLKFISSICGFIFYRYMSPKGLGLVQQQVRRTLHPFIAVSEAKSNSTKIFSRKLHFNVYKTLNIV